MNYNRVELSNAERDNKLKGNLWAFHWQSNFFRSKKEELTNDMQIFPACLASFVKKERKEERKERVIGLRKNYLEGSENNCLTFLWVELCLLFAQQEGKKTLLQFIFGFPLHTMNVH